MVIIIYSKPYSLYFYFQLNIPLGKTRLENKIKVRDHFKTGFSLK